MTLGAWKRDYREKVVIDDPSVSRFDALQDVKIAHRRFAKQATVVEASVNSGVGQIRAPKWARSNCQTHTHLRPVRDVCTWVSVRANRNSNAAIAAIRSTPI